MPKFSTPPVWYDKNGNLVETLTGSVGRDPEVTITNSMAIGKDSIAAGSSSVAIGEGAGSYGRDAVAIGYSSQTPSSGSIAIGSNTVAAHDNSYNSRGSIAIGNNSQVVGDGSIVIGSGIMLGDEEGPINDTIQIGSFDKTYSAQIGDGNGVLKCKASKASEASEIAPISYRINQNFSTGSSSISYPNGFILKKNGIYAFIFTVNGGYQTIPIVFNGTKSETIATYFNLSYGVTEGKKTIIYGSVLWENSSIMIQVTPIATPDATVIKVSLAYIVYLGSF